MNISVLDVVGPVMIGPSSSHTAGAVRLGAAARAMCPQPFDKVAFGLHGSFAKTYQGHGTDLALLGGVMGLAPDDERIREAQTLAKAQQLLFEFHECELEQVHENAVRIVFFYQNKQVQELIGSSVGGGRIMINSLNGCRLDLSAELPVLIVRHEDIRGMLNQITSVLLSENVNVGTLKLTRNTRGGEAWSIFEMDEVISSQSLERLRLLPGVLSAQEIHMEQGGCGDVS